MATGHDVTGVVRQYLILREDFLSTVEEIREDVPFLKEIVIRKNDETAEDALKRVLGSEIPAAEEKHFRPRISSALGLTLTPMRTPKP